MWLFLAIDEDNRVTSYGSTQSFEGQTVVNLDEDHPFFDSPMSYLYIDDELIKDTEHEAAMKAEFEEMQNRKPIGEEVALVKEITKQIVGDDTERMVFVANQVRRALQLFVQTLTEETALEVADLYPPWEANKAYKPGDIVRYGIDEDGEAQLFAIMQAHNSQADWLPPDLAALYKRIGFEADGTPVWVQPQGGHDAYAINDIVSHNGKTWKSTLNGNVWEPGVYGWTEQVGGG